MNCEQRMDDMQRFVDHDLTSVEEVGLLAHIKQCPDCAASFEQLQRLSAELSLLPMVPPPFSIVDSIMPKLAELDAQQAAINVAYITQGSKNSKRTLFNWKAAVGFAVAAAVFILVMVNMPDLNTSSKNDASGMLATDSALQARAEVGAVEPSGRETDAEAPEAATEGIAPEVGDKLMMKKTEPELKGQDSKALDDNPTSAAADTDSMKQTNDRLPQVMVEPSEEPIIVFGTAERAGDAGDAENTENYEDTNKIQVTSSEQSPPTPAPAIAIPSAEPASTIAPLAAIAPDPKAQSLVSDDGNLTGLIEHQIVQVQTPDGNRIYTSSIQWKAADQIRLLLWQDNQRMTYEVVMEDGTVKRFSIDPILKTEVELTAN